MSKEYDQYLEYAISSGIDPTDRLTLEEFSGQVNLEDDPNLESKLQSAFVSPTSGSVGKTIGGILTGFATTQANNYLKGAPRVNKIVNQMAGKAAGALGERIDSTIGKAKDSFVSGASTSGQRPPSGGGSSNGGGGSGRYNYGLMNLNPRPVTFNLTTPIVPSCVPKYFLDSPGSNQVSLLISCCKIQFDATNGANFYTFVDRVLLPQMLQRIQSNVKFRINLADFTTTNVVNYLTVLCDALQLFYYYTSIIEYCKPENKHTNDGMFALRDAMEYNDLNALYELNRVLEIYPIPPRLNELCWFMNQNYKMSTCPGSCLIKFRPTSFGTTTLKYFTPTSLDPAGKIDQVLSLLNTETNRRLAATLASAAPNWLNTNVVGSSPSTLYSPNFLTIFANSPFLNSLSASGPRAANEETAIIYQSYAERLDGAAYALTSIFNNTTSEWVPGMLSPVLSNVESSIPCNRFYYTTAGYTQQRFTMDTDSPTQMAMTSPYTYHKPGNGSNPSNSISGFAEERLYVTAASIVDSAIQLTEWLFGIDVMGVGTTLSVQNDGNSKARSKSRRGKRSRTSTDLGS